MKVFSYSNAYGFHKADNEWSTSVPKNIAREFHRS